MKSVTVGASGCWSAGVTTVISTTGDSMGVTVTSAGILWSGTTGAGTGISACGCSVYSIGCSTGVISWVTSTGACGISMGACSWGVSTTTKGASSGATTGS